MGISKLPFSFSFFSESVSVPLLLCCWSVLEAVALASVAWTANGSCRCFHTKDVCPGYLPLEKLKYLFCSFERAINISIILTEYTCFRFIVTMPYYNHKNNNYIKKKENILYAYISLYRYGYMVRGGKKRK